MKSTWDAERGEKRFDWPEDIVTIGPCCSGDVERCSFGRRENGGVSVGLFVCWQWQQCLTKRQHGRSEAVVWGRSEMRNVFVDEMAVRWSCC